MASNTQQLATYSNHSNDTFPRQLRVISWVVRSFRTAVTQLSCSRHGTARQRGVVTQPHTPPHGHSHMHTIVVGTKRIDRASRFQGETQMLTPLFLRFFRNDPELVHVAATPTHMFINIRIGTWQAPRAPRPSTSTYSCNRCSNSSRRPSHRLPAARSTHCSVSRGMSLKSTPNQCDRVFRRPGH